MILLHCGGASAYDGPMRSVLFLFTGLLCALCGTLLAQGMPPRENPYDVIGKMFQPLWGVFLSESVGANKAMVMTVELGGDAALLSGGGGGTPVRLAVQFPDKVRLEALVLGENVVVCRDGDRVWATPGGKIEYLLGRFPVAKRRAAKSGTPIPLPITAQQAIFLPALFTVERPDVAEVDEIDGVSYRVLTAGLMPELARVVNAENFQARIWVGATYAPRRMELRNGNFNIVVDIKMMEFSRDLPISTWAKPEGTGDVYSTNAEMLESLLSAVMNSLGSRAARVGAR